VEVSGAPTGFVMLLLILWKRFYNSTAKKEMRFEILLVGDDDPPDRRQAPAGLGVDESRRPPDPPVRPRGQTPLVQSTSL
jgi:hypothetical protein